MLSPMRFLLPLLFACLAACATVSPAERTQAAQRLAAAAGWQAETIDTGRFRLLSLHPAPTAVDTLAIFIEGDGLAWIDRHTPSADPTPRTPLALQLALAEPLLTAAYLGRPCQYDAAGTPTRCRTADWTEARFSAEIVAAMDAAASRLKQRFNARRLVLVGYSGGATIAALLAARRHDVSRLITVAGLLDHAAWTARQRLAPLTGSLNPVAAWDRLQSLPQIHYVGSDDRITGRAALGQALASPSSNAQVVEIAGFTHACCWPAHWPRLARERDTAP